MLSLCRIFRSICSSFLFLLLFEDCFVTSKWYSQRATDGYGLCEESQILNKVNGEYDFAYELSNRDFCVLIAPPQASTVTVEFLSFAFGFKDVSGNCSEFLEISYYEGYSTDPPTRYCGYTLPPAFTSHSGSVWIRVHRDGSYSEKPERITIRYSSVTKCNTDIKIDKYTFISSPTYHVRGGISCNWVVSLQDPSEHQTLQVQLNNWTVHELGMIGGWATVSIHDGNGGPVLASFTPTTSASYVTKQLLTTTRSEVSISFSTDRFNSFSAFFNATVKVKGFCVPGTLPCGDGINCYSESQICDGELQCSTGYDELGCKSCHPTQFWCGKEAMEQCYTISERCNGFKDCQGSREDESNCKSCGPGSFLCVSENKCIYERWACDGDYDCADGSDEQGCTYAATRRVITAAVIGSLVCSLLLVIAIGCTCKLYSLRASHHRHPHHHYRATPLTRVERELFARQAPPTYDMTINGVSTENSGSRSQRNRRRRSRRYQFQRAAPANVGHQSNFDNNRQEGSQSSNGGSGSSSSTAQTPTSSSVTTQQTNSSSSGDPNTPGTDIAQQLGAFLFESLRNGSGTQEGGTAQPRTSTPAPTVTRDSGTQTNSATRNDAQSSSSTSGSQRSSSSGRRSNRSSSRSRSSRASSSSSNSKDQQAKPLPKKKRILPVMVPAPCADVVVEEDVLACVYPCPPSYSQAVSSGSSPNLNEPMEPTVDDLEESSSSVENQEEDSSLQEQPDAQDGEFSPENDSLTTVTRSRFFPFSIKRAIRNIASASFSRFQRNPYLQMSPQESRRNSEQDQSGVDSPLQDSNSFSTTSQPRPSTSSDEDLLDFTIENQSLRRDSTDQLLLSNPVPTSTLTDTPTAPSTTGKIFPQRRNLSFFTRRDKGADDTNSLDMSDFTMTPEDQ